MDPELEQSWNAEQLNSIFEPAIPLKAVAAYLGFDALTGP